MWRAKLLNTPQKIAKAGPMKIEMNAITNTEPVHEGAFTASFCFPETFVGFDGHFPKQPVLPGICLIQAVLVAAQKATGRNLTLSEIVLAKFISVVLPNQQVQAACTVDAEMVRAKLSRGEDRVAEIRLRIQDA
jgi:3-hydroxymyristoyl/3-hydroxydecanoyl-(acyl carrier protein) dehydratase